MPSPKPKAAPASPAIPDPRAELRRLNSHPGPQCWTSSIRRSLLADGLIERTYADGKWMGDRLTDEGLALVKEKR